ncbi:MAG TPA: methylenetetrahydrofolate--tRNA-(uracil(54)-C(5))-methyltransferase (FADH(2)-oxidizing) TrmFO [Candidatus Hydrothermia bacterium]|nr:methylenetetrahydrofolate--tRNA-(uracil(54)-C(5))-methyltransferase (FADH(2)-oxidizing) TrmFO [Candidatus Hydrothermia bacterium]
MKVAVLGGGLAGSECALNLAKAGIDVELYEMRPRKSTPVHKTSEFAELVCSNSLKSMEIHNAHGVLKEEMGIIDSVLLKVAKMSAISSSRALVVDRNIFSRKVTELIESNSRIKSIREEVTEFPDADFIVVSTGPLTSNHFANYLKMKIGEDFLNFYDAVAPVVLAESLDYSKMYFKDRHGDDDEIYLNIPLTKEEYLRFVNELNDAEVHQPHLAEDKEYFEACLPIEIMAARGEDTLRYGPMRPDGLTLSWSKEKPYAVLQLRAENREKTLFSIVGFQTQMTMHEQERVFRMIPGMEMAEFAVYGKVHRNTYINVPRVLDNYFRLTKMDNVFFAGQLLGTEGYVEAIWGGLLVSIFIIHILKKGVPPELPPVTTMTGALLDYITHYPHEDFKPMNANFGLINNVHFGIKGRDRRIYKAKRAVKDIAEWKDKNLSGIF